MRWLSPPVSEATTVMPAVTIMPAGMMRPPPRRAATTAAITAAGHTLIQVATASITPAMNGNRESTSSAITTTGATTPSRRSIATGESTAIVPQPDKGGIRMACVGGCAQEQRGREEVQDGHHREPHDLVRVGPEEVGDADRQPGHERVHPVGGDAHDLVAAKRVDRPVAVEHEVAERLAAGDRGPQGQQADRVQPHEQCHHAAHSPR